MSRYLVEAEVTFKVVRIITTASESKPSSLLRQVCRRSSRATQLRRLK